MSELKRPSEKIAVCDLQKSELLFPMDRNDFYREQIKIFREKGRPTKASVIVDILLFDLHGDLLVQRRSHTKKHNPDLFDKSIGGHVVYGDSPDFTVMVESVQELKVPSIVLRNDQDYAKTFDLLHNYLDIVALVKNIEVFVEPFIKIIDNEEVVIANKKHLYFGIYNGSIQTIDRESRGVLLYSLHELENEMIKFPERFTMDMHFYTKRYADAMRDFIANTISKLQ